MLTALVERPLSLGRTMTVLLSGMSSYQHYLIGTNTEFEGWTLVPIWTTSACSVAACGASTGSSPKKGVSVSLTNSCLYCIKRSTKFLARMKPDLGTSSILAPDPSHVAKVMLRH